MYEAKVLADSLSAEGTRLITVQATFPRFILAELNTHRVFSRNSASSRAIPPEKLIAKVAKNPFIPETFNARVKGMGVGEALASGPQNMSRELWLSVRDKAVTVANQLNDIGVDKSRVNRLLEPFMWHTAIISSTDWDNFFALRCPPGDEPTIDFPAQLEFQKIAILMRQAMRASTPTQLRAPFDSQWPETNVFSEKIHVREYWHMPLVDPEEVVEQQPDAPEGDRAHFKFWPMVSAGRCARVSFDTHENFEEPEVSYDRAERLKSNGHMSPFEHVARSAWKRTDKEANFRGWVQLRQEIPHEENRIGYLDQREPWDAP